MVPSFVAFALGTTFFVWGLKDRASAKPISLVCAKWFIALIAFADIFIPMGKYGPTIQFVSILIGILVLRRYWKAHAGA